MKKENKDLNKKFEQKMALDKVIKQSFVYQQNEKEESYKRRVENMMKWNEENLSPNGGKKAFRKTQKEMMTPKRKGGWLTKNEEL